MANRYQLNDEVRQKYIPIIRDHITAIESCNLEEKSRYEIALDLSDTELNPYTLGTLLEEEFGYERDDQSDNGWQMDFWIYYKKQDKPDLLVQGTGITFELNLRGNEDDEQDYESDEFPENLRTDEEFNQLIESGMKILEECEKVLHEE